MGLYDRDYTQENFQHRFGNAPQMRMRFPQITPAVMWLLIINLVVFFAQILGGDELLTMWGSVLPVSLGAAFQLWRLITYQFLHGGIGHVLFNMIGLFFLGPTLEKHWGTKRFLRFYLSCGVAGGLFFTLLVGLGFLQSAPMVGASSGILGLLAACAILFPHFVVFFFLFPVPIRVAAVILTLLYVVNLLTLGPNAGGDAAHLAGMAAGAFYVVSRPWRYRLKMKTRASSWKKQKDNTLDLRAEVDRILAKVHNQGIHSLTSREKRILKEATRTQRQQYKL